MTSGTSQNSKNGYVGDGSVRSEAVLACPAVSRLRPTRIIADVGSKGVVGIVAM
jgi:hypothetical protein